jgi:hypothetical protein
LKTEKNKRSFKVSKREVRSSSCEVVECKESELAGTSDFKAVSLPCTLIGVKHIWSHESLDPMPKELYNGRESTVNRMLDGSIYPG